MQTHHYPFEERTTILVLEELIHRDLFRLAIFFPYDPAVKNKVRSIAGCRYSKTLRCWHLPLTQESYDKIKALGIDYRWRRKPEKVIENDSQGYIAIDDYWKERLDKFQEYLYQQRYSEQSIKSYMMILRIFFAWWGERSIYELTIEALQRFNYKYFIEGNYSSSYQNIWVSAMKLYLKRFTDVSISFSDLERPRPSKHLPNVLSIAEVKRLIASYDNIKHRTIIMMYYACGLRKAELLNLRLIDVDMERGVIRIRNSKGAKDRDVALPGALAQLLMAYMKRYKPVSYLFNGQGSLQYSASSVDKLLKRGLKKAKIYKRITTHSLRHSYATHLVERNINLRYIQDALGHKNSKTTEIYTKLSRENIANMVSPIDFWDENKAEDPT